MIVLNGKWLLIKLEGSLTGAQIDYTHTEVPVVAVEANADEYTIAEAKASKIKKSSDDMEIDIEEKRKTDAYNMALNIDIWKIDKTENIHNHHKTHWKKI